MSKLKESLADRESRNQELKARVDALQRKSTQPRRAAASSRRAPGPRDGKTRAERQLVELQAQADQARAELGEQTQSIAVYKSMLADRDFRIQALEQDLRRLSNDGHAETAPGPEVVQHADVADLTEAAVVAPVTGAAERQIHWRRRLRNAGSSRPQTATNSPASAKPPDLIPADRLDLRLHLANPGSAGRLTRCIICRCPHPPRFDSHPQRDWPATSPTGWRSPIDPAALAAWLPPKILSLPAWLGELRADYLLNAGDDRVPVTAQQAQLLWQSLIDQSVFIGEPRVAVLAQRAWRLIHEYGLDAPGLWPSLLLSEDSQRFKDWAGRFQRLCEQRGLIDEWSLNAELPRHIEAGVISVPAQIELAGFDLPMPPLQIRILDAAQAVGTRLIRHERNPHPHASVPVHACPESDDELRAAAQWARRQLEAGGDRAIAVVVPDLADRLPRVEALFREVFDPPGFALGGTGADAWHISLGRPLSRWPLVADALTLLQLSDQQLTQPVANRLLHSPFLPGWVSEADARTRALEQLVRSAAFELTHHEFERILTRSGVPGFAERFKLWQTLRRENPGPAWPSVWVGRFQQELSTLGFAGGRALDSREHQVLQHWHDLLETLGTLDTVADAPMPRTRILALLTESAAGTVFREQNTGAPVEVLGVEEALGSEFDALWVTGLDTDTWPGPARREPLIPAGIQTQVPRSTPAGALDQARLELNILRHSAALIEGSFAHGSDEVAAEVTALFGECAVTELDPGPLPAAAPMAAGFVDDRAPDLELTDVQGGTGVLRDQSDCPFRAFAARRLRARDLTPPRPGLDAGQRGTVIHKALEHFWRDPTDRDALLALSETDLSERINRAVATALDDFTRDYRLLLSRSGRLLEQRRTERVVHRWLALERARSGFEVIAQEQPIKLEFGGFRLNGKIDRIDRLADGSTLLIDYKTGRASRSGWYPQPRIEDPQLPAYAVAMDPAPGAIAFARIRPEELRFDGLSSEGTDIEGVTVLADAQRRFRSLDDWPELLTSWRTHLEALARDFSAGVAAVDPRSANVCRTCHLHALCRIQERAPFASLIEDSAAGSDADE